jgi:hypothetical protein
MVMEAGDKDLAHILENKKIQNKSMMRIANDKNDSSSNTAVRNKGAGLDVQFLRETWQHVSNHFFLLFFQ